MKRRGERLFGALAALGLVLLLALPAQAGATSGMLTVAVHTPKEEGTQPLANITLEVFRTAMEPEETAQTLAAVLTTDRQGLAQAPLEPGVYLVSERPAPAVSAVLDPFYITVSREGTSLQLEKTPERGPGIRLDVAELDCKSASYAMEEPHTWIIRAQIPAGIAGAQCYRITDVLDWRLDHIPGTTQVLLCSGDGREVPLTGSMYILDERVQVSNGKNTDVLQVSLTPEGMDHVAAHREEGAELRIRFRAAIRPDAQMAAAIPNDAHLEYINSAGICYEADSDIPEVHTGGVTVQCTDPTGLPAAGISWKLLREATEEEKESGYAVPLKLRGKTVDVVALSFFSRGERKYMGKTDEGGLLSMEGLAYGTYYLLPEEGQPVMIRVDQASHLPENTVRLQNSREAIPALPELEPLRLQICGFCILSTALLLMGSNRKRSY